MDPFWSVLVSFRTFQFILELSILRMRKGQFVHKMYIIVIWLLQFWSKCGHIACIQRLQRILFYSNSVRQISRQMVTPTLLRPRITQQEPECNVSLERLAFIATTLWRIQWQAQVHVVVGCVLWRQGQAVAGQPPQSLRRILVVIWTFLCTRLANKPGPWERICRPLLSA